jgi:hypothetical protein
VSLKDLLSVNFEFHRYSTVTRIHETRQTNHGPGEMKNLHSFHDHLISACAEKAHPCMIKIKRWGKNHENDEKDGQYFKWLSFLIIVVADETKQNQRMGYNRIKK